MLYSIVVPIWAYGLLFGDQPNKLSFFWRGVGDPAVGNTSFKTAPENTDLPLNQAEVTALQSEVSLGYFDSSTETTVKLNEALAKTDWRAQLTAELTSPRDFVFVSGEFRRAWIQGDLVLVHDFVGSNGMIWLEKFEPVVFYVTFPPGTKDAELERYPQARKLTIFGKPVHGLDKDGMIEMRALAVY
jgi:hypothetical protein